MTPPLPSGFRVAGVHCGIKRSRREDICLVLSDAPLTAAGVYTTNRVCAAPVLFDRQRTPSPSMRVVITNSGNANACTGEQGERDTQRMAEMAARACSVSEQQALVMSTGIIGEPLPMDKIEEGIRSAAEKLASGEDALRAAARGILTTDKVDKLAGRSIDTEHGPVQITGIAKGSGMIGPNMATMLALIMTDAALDPDEAQALLAATNDDTFNCISVDGHTSTNDTALLLASGKAARLREGDRNWPAFAQGVHEVCEDLAKQIVRDGEGATHLVEIFASGCADKAAARTVARTIANSPLVKTAIAGADPNWGRIVSAAGYAGVEFDPQGTSLKVAGTLLYDRGQPVPFDAEEVSAAIRGSADTKIEISFSAGQASARFWTCDLTIEYIHINADYHT